ncbi:hypothetical protein [Luteimonas sp. SDU101]|uniref:hypothetical protein n=1 Tax=Luteimonas sp. SDU101 TaxID=3422593 RepID=UPI003EBECBDC
MSDLLHFIHGLNIFNLTKGQAPDEINTIDYTPTNIANARLDAINRNANQDFFDDMAERADKANQERRKTLFAAVRIGADRLALHRTLEHIQAQLRRGASVDQVFAQAQEFRKRQYREILRERASRIEGGIKSIGDDETKLAQTLLDGLPISNGRSSRPGMAPDR